MTNEPGLVPVDRGGGCLTHGLVWLGVSALLIVLILGITGLCYGLYRLVG